MAAGKSTLAIELSKKYDAILLSEDVWLAQLYPEEIKNISDYLNYSERLKNILENHVKNLLLHGSTVVLDFPGNTIRQRTWFRHIFEQAKVLHYLHYIDLSDQICKQQLKKRNEGKPEGAAFTSDAEFDEITKYFQPPSDDEGFNIIHHENEKY